MTSIMLHIERFADEFKKRLSERFESEGFKWKNSEDPSIYNESLPSVSVFTFDEVDGNDMPQTPSILFQVINAVENNTSVVCQMLAYIAVSNPSTQDKEITSGHDNVWTYGDGDKFTSKNARSELYKQCFLLSEIVFSELSKLDRDSYRIDGITLNAPSPYMDNFPYCEGTVSFNFTVNAVQNINNTQVFDLL